MWRETDAASVLTPSNLMCSHLVDCFKALLISEQFTAGGCIMCLSETEALSASTPDQKETGCHIPPFLAARAAAGGFNHTTPTALSPSIHPPS